VWLIALLVAALGGGQPPQAGSSDRPAYASAEQVDVAGEPALVLRPHEPGDRVVLFAHGTGEQAATLATEKRKSATIRALLEAGYAVAASDAHGDAWGNAQSVRDYLALVAHLRAEGLRRVYVLAESQGGLASLLLLRRAPARAWAGIYPVCDVLSVYHRHSPGYKRSIRAAYGVRNLVELRGRAASRSPVTPLGVRGLPMIFWASPQDDAVSKAANTDRCARLAAERGAKVTVVATIGEHGNASNFDPARLVRFFDAAG
jgi:pimeloyl-ACP methyl ester carboxylesterase